MNYPEIRFKNPWLLMDAIRTDIEPAYANELEKLEPEFINQTLERYEKAWRPNEEKIIRGMCEMFHREFKQNVIDVYAAPLYNSISEPMIIATKYDNERVVEVIAHEMIHRLLSDNAVDDDSHTVNKWRKSFGDEHDFVTLVHIPVHAGLEAIFCDVLGEPERLENDKKAYEKYPPYHAAWKYVEQHGYQNIIDQVKQ